MAKKGQQKVEKLHEQEATVNVSRTVLGRKSDKADKIKIRPFVTATASVSVKYGMTISTGSYESARVDVMVTAPCYVEELPEMYAQVREMVDDLISQETAEIMEGSDAKE